MSNPRAWRAKPRTSKPNSRQKRNGLFLDCRPVCQRCWSARSTGAHHALPKGHPSRNEWVVMQALCEPCHVGVHNQPRISYAPLVYPSVSSPFRISVRIASGRDGLGGG